MEFSHFNKDGNAYMVDVSEKNKTKREARAFGKIKVSKEVISQLINHQVKKGEVLGVARVAGIMGMKKTSEIIPMCHPIFMSGCEINFEIKEDLGEIHIYVTAKTIGETGIEMEVLTGVSTAALTIYDMCKSIDKRMVISDIHLLEKTGGKSGDFKF
ncbi:cyclic pyranopterin monophosphate synthase MoaC [Fusobacterium sp.]|uniref:cyclic pyranopterin monophosphate synthase MoaC n=1 Tax=Fusobacterium sp. TaxID=68766 RepID=UPI002635B03A|nr:cyclic pyranopterin monophosphate synthase MoaC [Fusobacterium sp.]